MTKRFNVFYTCDNCGSRQTAETGFGRWCRNNTALDSSYGMMRTDTDHWFLRYKTSSHGREFQLLMAVEVKEYGANPDKPQRDILSFVRQMVEGKGKNMYSAPTNITKKLFSKLNQRWVKVRWCGVHLLQFEKTSPTDSKWIAWDDKPISVGHLQGVLALEMNPYKPGQRMDELLRDRHAKIPEFPFVMDVIQQVKTPMEAA